MPVKNPNTPFPRPYVDAYWELVRRCLTDIFAKPTERAEELQQEVEALPYARQDIYYHDSPLHVAEDLAEQRATESQHAQFQEMVKAYQFPELDEL